MSDYYVITGASSGIGYALCCHLASHNKHVIAVARRDEYLQSLQNKFLSLITIIQADLATQTGRDAVTKKVGSIRNIKGIVNNAASNDPISLLQHISINDWHQQIAINIDAPVFLTQSLLPFLSGGRIINLTTGTTQFIVSGIASYAMTKAAINIFSKYLSNELRTQNILVAAAHPGVVMTAMAENISTFNHSKLFHEIKYLDVNISAKFLCWLLLNADDSLYTGDIIGIYNQKYQPLWHNEMIPSPYPVDIDPP